MNNNRVVKSDVVAKYCTCEECSPENCSCPFVEQCQIDGLCYFDKMIQEKIEE